MNIYIILDSYATLYSLFHAGIIKIIISGVTHNYMNKLNDVIIIHLVYCINVLYTI